jgi:hypothetical protein
MRARYYAKPILLEVIYDPLTSTVTSSIDNSKQIKFTTQGEQYILNPGDTITYSETYSIDLVQGWNLIAFPVLPQDISVENVLNAIQNELVAVWMYDGVQESWKSYSPGAPSSLDIIDKEHGFWIKVDSSTVLSLSND